MNISEVSSGIYRLSSNVENILFEGLWPIPNGVAMNSYLVKGEKTAIIDGVCGWDGVPETLLSQLDQIGVVLESIDYVIINHMEPDHTGWLEAFKKIRPEFKVLTSEKAVPMLEAFFDITLDVEVVQSGDTLDLGKGRVLAFQYIPNVHWPETMATFDTQSGTLFSCDAFGTFGKVGDKMYDDQLTEEELQSYILEGVRYYSNIVASFSQPVLQAIDKCSSLPIKTIAPGHGIVWRKNPGRIIEDYTHFASWSKGPAKKEITLIWGSMYGNTEMGVAPVIKRLEKEGMVVRSFQVPQSTVGDILASIWSSSGVVLAMPTYEYKMFPPMADILEELGKKKVLNRKAFRFGSYGWSGGAQRELDHIIEHRKMRWDFVEPVEFKGKPSEEDIHKLEEQATKLAESVKEWVDGEE